MSRIVVKVGSNVLTTEKGKLNITRLSALVDQIAWLKQHQYEVILVSSGAVACGRQELKVDHELDSAEQRQLFSAMGQVKLINLYYDLFREYNIHIGQVLTMKENFEAGEQYKNQRYEGYKAHNGHSSRVPEVKRILSTLIKHNDLFIAYCDINTRHTHLIML